ncbi:glycosyltransferase family 4 protein [Frigidibacter sp. SD6-1]|uniref:glycosyltransferase family 4 protein n=1 Tax=Frigidibacter sp. SD6-1 TaxID=3032581 RepID=UPI0024DFF219|nr:glycosyltransferase family 4 protein [Frigidibacter sp. SD6-1]
MKPGTKQLRILEIGTQLGVGGITRHILALRDWLVAHGHEVTLAGSPDVWVNGGTGHPYLELPVNRVAGGGGSLPGRLMALAGAAWRLRRWLKRHPVDVIHAHDSAPALVAALARKGLNIPLIVTYHGSEPERIAGFGRIARMCDLTVTPSHRSAEDLATIGGVPPERLKVIGLGVAPPPEVSAAEVAALRARLMGDGERVILTLVRLAHQKGVDILIDCVARLRKDHPGWRFIVAGDGPDEAALKTLARERGVLPSLSFIGRTSEPHLHLCAADLFLLTSRWEALPFTIVEAFRAGCPAVATACSGVVELIDESVGRVVPVGDVAAICGAVEAVLADETARRELGAAALARAGEDRFDPDWIHPQFEALYRSLARQEGRR